MSTSGNEPSTAVQSPSVYSAPRRYDLATMFVVSVAYAVLFAVMRLLQAGPLVFVTTGLFFTAIAAAQALLFTGNAPRLASCIAGSLYFVGSNAAFMLLNSVNQSQQFRLVSSIIAAVGGLICVAVSGAICGYVGGALVGGVFLVADQLRRGRQFLKGH